MTGDAGDRGGATETAGILDVGAPIHVPYEVEVPGFSGPLELLLHLCRKHKLDILDIPVGFVTRKYLEYLEAMKTLNLDVAAEYLEMAATLTRIKSRMLLPSGADTEETEGAEEGGDPRAELVRRLLEYQKYRDAADRLASRAQLDRDVFIRRADRPAESGERALAEVGIGALLDAFAAVLKRVGADVAREITVERISVANRIQEVVALLQDRRRMRFEQLFEGAATRFDLVVTFLALLEMTKLRMTRLVQAGPEAPLLVEFVGAATDGEVAAEGVTADVAPPGGEAVPPATGETVEAGPPDAAVAPESPDAAVAPESPDADANLPPFLRGRKRGKAKGGESAEPTAEPAAAPPEAPPQPDKQALLASALSVFLAGRDEPPKAEDPGDEEKPE
ncbi:MAG: segregation/condensation protein A [Deltaproteobacteria bacterium]|nr:segregation/condensation protein A [Deltaproteobacteria bacterium]